MFYFHSVFSYLPWFSTSLRHILIRNPILVVTKITRNNYGDDLIPKRLPRPCNQSGCPNLSDSSYCEEHKRKRDAFRGSSTERGYTYRWQKYSKWFLHQPDNIFCKLQLPGCNNIANCVDHVDPPDSANDPRFWDKSNHQSACIRCNSVKGKKRIVGAGQPFEARKGVFGR